MVLKFKYGFEYLGFQYGWLNKELYRLPSTSGNYHYGLKKLNIIKVGNKKGYRIKRDRMTIEQLKVRTTLIEREVAIIKDKDIPS